MTCPECGVERVGTWREHANTVGEECVWDPWDGGGEQHLAVFGTTGSMFAPAHPTCPNCHTTAAPVEDPEGITRQAAYAAARSTAVGPGLGDCPICAGAGCRPCRYTGSAKASNP